MFTAVERQRRAPANVTRRAAATSRQAMTQRRLRRRRTYKILAQTYSSPIPRGSGFRYSRDRLHAPDDRRLRRLEQRRQLGQRHGRRRRSTTRCATRVAQPAWRTSQMLDMRERARRPPAVREHRRPARGEGRRHLDERRARSTRPSGCSQIRTRHDALPALPAAGGRAPELLGPARAAQLLPPGLQRRRRRAAARASRGQRASTPRRAEHEPRLTLDDGRHPCGARIGNGCRASAVSACAVTHTGVWALVRE